MNKIKEIISKISNLILANISNEEIKITEKINSNRVDIILGLRIPGIKSSFENIQKKIKENIIKFHINEFNLRNRKNDINDENQFKEDYWKELKRFSNSTSLEIKNENYISKIIETLEEKDLYLFYEILINDYYIFFINNNLNYNYDNRKLIKIESVKNMLALLIKIKNEKYGDKIKEKEKEVKNDNNELKQKNKLREIANTINWIECYKEEIIIILKTYAKLDLKINNLYKLIKDIIYNENIKYEISERNPEYTGIVNEVIFLGIESLLKILITNKELFNGINDVKKLIELINFYREILQDISKIQNNLMLYSKEMFSLEEIVEIFDLYYINKVNKKECFIEIFKYFINEAKLINEKDNYNLKNNFDILFKTLQKYIGNDKNFSRVMNIIFINEFKKSDDKDFRIELMNILLKNKELVYGCSYLIELILGDYLKYDLVKFKDNIKNLQNCDLIEFLNEKCKENEILKEMLINCFEFHINLYFNEIEKKFEKKDDIINYFIPKANNEEEFTAFYNFEESINKLKEERIEDFPICKLYLISFIKMYLNKVAYYYMENNQLSITEIIEIIKGINNDPLRIVIKYYFFKLLYNYSANYEEFNKLPFNIINIIIDEDNEIFMKERNDKNEILIYHFLPLNKKDDLKQYLNISKEFNEKMNQNQLDNEIIQHLLENNDLDIFVNLILNKIISNLGLNENILKDILPIFSKFEFNKYLNENICKLFSLYFNDNIFNIKIKQKLLKDGEIDQKLFIILLYGFRYCVQSLNENNLYGRLFDKNCSSILRQYFIPGNHIQDDLHLLTLFDIKEHFNKYPSDKGCYICSCGYYYSIDPCGFPNKDQFSNCPKCKEVIGYRINNNPNKLEYCLEYRKGHYRIFKNDEDKKYEMKKCYVTNDMVPNRLYNDYINEIIKPILKKENSGLNKIKKYLFLSTPEKIRNLSKIGYRLLSFIIYSHLFFANCLDYISDEELKNNFLVEDMTCLEIIEKNWNLLKEALNEKSINSIEIFMNLIFKKLSKAFNKCKSLKTLEERNAFEEKVENIIAKSIVKYKDYKEIYLNDNLNELGLDIDNLKIIVNEMFGPEKYTGKYPLFKYFMLTKYPDKNDFINKKAEIGDEIFRYKYPLTYQYLLDENNKTKMKNLFEFNEFCNNMIDSYSFKISREAAKEACIYSPGKEDFPEEQFENFLKVWENIYVDVQNFKGDTKNIKKLSKDDKLIKFLNDDKDKNILSAYQYFISNQNSFLQPIYNVISLNGILHFYAHTLKNRIPIQEAKLNNILSFDDVNIETIIYKYSKRDILKGDGKIDYFNYNTFTYDFHSIEKELGELILPGKYLFDENKLRFVSFWFEGNTDIFANFAEIYKQIDLDKNQEKKIQDSFEKFTDINDIKDILSFFQSFIYYLNNNKCEGDESIEKILIQYKSNNKVRKEILEFFNENNFKVNQLLNIFLYLENLFFDKIEESIEEDNNLLVNEEYNKNEECLKDIIKKIDLHSALRRYISRYLVDKNYVSNNLNKNLSLELSRAEFWNVDEIKFNGIKEILNGEFEKLNITIKEAMSLYTFINNNKEE